MILERKVKIKNWINEYQLFGYVDIFPIKSRGDEQKR